MLLVHQNILEKVPLNIYVCQSKCLPTQHDKKNTCGAVLLLVKLWAENL